MFFNGMKKRGHSCLNVQKSHMPYQGIESIGGIIEENSLIVKQLQLMIMNGSLRIVLCARSCDKSSLSTKRIASFMIL